MIKHLTPQLAERGKIKIGEKGEKRKGQGGKEWRLPVKLDYFKITTMERDKEDQLITDTALIARLMEIQKSPAGCGRADKLVEIPIRLLYDEIELNFQTRLACYKSLKLDTEKEGRLRCWCSGDNETAQRLQLNGTFKEGPCPCERCQPEYDKADKCKFLGTLQCLIDSTDRIGGVWKFRTTSYNSVNAIYASLLLIKTITGGGRLDDRGLPNGPLAGIPLKMMISPKTVTVPSGPHAGQNMVIQVVSLEYAGGEEQLAQVGYNMRHRRVDHQIRMANLERQARRAIAAPHEEPPADQEETGKEFFAEPEIIEGQTLEQDLAEFASRLADHSMAEDNPILLKFLEAKAREYSKTLDEIRVAAVADWEPFWDDFEVFRQGQKEGEEKAGLITQATMDIIRGQCKDLAGLMAREGVRNLEELTETRGGQIVDMLNAEAA